VELNKQYLDEQFIKANALYDTGDYATAFRIFMSLADSNDTASMCWLGNMYAAGQGVVRSFEKAIYWEMQAAENGDVSALFNLGISHRNQGRIREARFWFEKGLEKGDSENALELAKLYFVSDKELEIVDRYLKIALASENLIEASREEAIDFLDKLRELQKT
jgi:TPR repeat protein